LNLQETLNCTTHLCSMQWHSWLGECWGPTPWDGSHGWPQETRPSPLVLPCQAWMFCIRGCRHK